MDTNETEKKDQSGEWIESVKGLVALRPAKGGYSVEDRFIGQTFLVQVAKGRFVGKCSCGREEMDPFRSCLHQIAVREYLLKRFIKERRCRSKVARARKGE